MSSGGKGMIGGVGMVTAVFDGNIDGFAGMQYHVCRFNCPLNYLYLYMHYVKIDVLRCATYLHATFPNLLSTYVPGKI